MSASANLIESAKRLAARAAVDKNISSAVKVLGVGSGSTIVYSFERVVELFNQGKLNPNLVCIPTSYQSRILINKAGLRCGQLDDFPNIDLTIDGADEATIFFLPSSTSSNSNVDAQLNAIKGGGAAHFGEKAVAIASKKLVLVADFRKNSEALGMQWRAGVPVEVVPSTLGVVMNKVMSISNDPKGNKLFEQLNIAVSSTKAGKIFELEKPVPTLRAAVRKAGPVVTDNGNFVLDVDFGKIYNPLLLEVLLKQITGVLEVGIFSNMAEEAWFGNEDGTVSIRNHQGIKLYN